MLLFCCSGDYRPVAGKDSWVRKLNPQVNCLEGGAATTLSRYIVRLVRVDKRPVYKGDLEVGWLKQISRTVG